MLDIIKKFFIYFLLFLIFILFFYVFINIMKKYVEKLGEYRSLRDEPIVDKIFNIYWVYNILSLPLSIVLVHSLNKQFPNDAIEMLIKNASVLTASILTSIRILANPTYFLNKRLDYDLAVKYKETYLKFLQGFFFSSYLILFIILFSQVMTISAYNYSVGGSYLFSLFSFFLFYQIFLFLAALTSEIILSKFDPIHQQEFMRTKHDLKIEQEKLLRKASLPDFSRFFPKFKFWKKKDYFFFYFLIPILLTFTYLLPENIKQDIILNLSNPTIISMFFSNYVHLELTHFLGNLISYLIVIFLLFNLETNRILFYRSSLLIFIILPFVSSFLVISIFPSLPPSLGFSAIVAGFMGYLVYSVFRYIKEFYYPQINNFFLYLILMINLIVVANNLGTPITFQIFILSILIILIYLNRVAIKEIGKIMMLKFKDLFSQKSVGRLIYKYLLFILIIISIFNLPNLIPSKIKIGSSIINIFSHYVGYLFGLFIPLIINFFSKLTNR